MIMKYSGVIFDFNGTLFWDTMYHNKAWDIFLMKYNKDLSDDEKFKTIHGKNNRDIFRGLFGNDLPETKIEELIYEKEGLYQKLCLELFSKTDDLLAPGAVRFFEFLKEQNIPFTIATASDKFNVDFYFEHLGIDRWFDYDKVVYNDGKIKGKPNPDIYNKAIALLGLAPKDIIVFEDAIAGLEAAKNAHVGNIIIVDSNDDDYSGWYGYQRIKNFDEVSRDLF